MKGIVLAGGLGTRLDPLTRVTNKHLLPVYDRPMIYYPLETLISAGITEIMLVTGGQNAGGFLELLGNGHELGLEHLNYTYQKGHGGIAEALGLCEHFVGGDRMCVILGDNLLQRGIGDQARAFEAQPGGARILLKEVPDPARFGVPVFDGKGKILRIEEKPKKPASPYAVIGIYFYDDLVWETIRGLSPSARNELEITDVNNAYLERGLLEHGFVDGWWTDAGTFESLFRATELVRREGAGEGGSP
ncbi:MAG TPA: sugar phosphate nucleotidyltransferase [bacterium]|nr:sugar phosphate nucleotidyltransferase [bacterium]